MFRAFLTLLAFLQAMDVFAEDSSFFAARRESLMKKINGAVAVLQGAPDTRAYVSFRQDNNFYYLTGVETPDSLLLLDAKRSQTLLFLPTRDQESERWEGIGLSPGPEAQRRTGIDQVLDLSRFDAELEQRCRGGRILYIPFSPQEVAATSRDRALQHDSARERDPWDGRPSRELAFESKLHSKLGSSISIRNLSPFLDEMRRIKDAQEIEMLRTAGEIGAMGLTEAMRSAEPGMYEYQVAAVAEFIFSWNGASGPAFYPIVGSGPNSCVPHYDRNQRRMLPGDIVVFDFGPDFRYYQVDITRTFPISGKFTEAQARVYTIVLNAQKAALEKIRPGVTLGEINRAVKEALDRFGFAGYGMHAASHYVGMSTHDVGVSETLEPGAVIAVEPGVYLPDKDLGVRIEDTVLVTANGHEVLTRKVPKEIDEIEKLMAGKGLTGAAIK